MVRRTRRKGGMIKLVTKATQPIGRAAVTLGKEYSKDYMQKKLPEVTKGLYEEPSLAKNPAYIMTGTKPMPIPNFNIYDSENVNPNIMRGGKTKRNNVRNNRRNKRKVKTRKNRK